MPNNKEKRYIILVIKSITQRNNREFHSSILATLGSLTVQAKYRKTVYNVNSFIQAPEKCILHFVQALSLILLHCVDLIKLISIKQNETPNLQTSLIKNDHRSIFAGNNFFLDCKEDKKSYSFHLNIYPIEVFLGPYTTIQES